MARTSTFKRLFFVACALSASTSTLVSAELDHSNAPTTRSELEYVIFENTLKKFLTVMSSDTGMRFQVADGVSAVLRDTRLSGSQDDILDTLAGTHELDWYPYNDVVYVSQRRDAATRIVRLGDLSTGHVIANLTNAGLPVERFPVSAAPESSALTFSGPPSYLALVEAMVEVMPSQAKAPLRTAEGKFVIERRGTEIKVVSIK